MGETYQEGSGSGADFDLTQFYQIFFEEASENLDQMESMLLDLDLEKADDEELNGIFRCAHSIKGGAATFGFSDVAELTHQMESLLDKLRRHELQPVPQMVDVLLESADASRNLLARHQSGAQDEPPSPLISCAVSASWRQEAFLCRVLLSRRPWRPARLHRRPRPLFRLRPVRRQQPRGLAACRCVSDLWSA